VWSLFSQFSKICGLTVITLVLLTGGRSFAQSHQLLVSIYALTFIVLVLRFVHDKQEQVMAAMQTATVINGTTVLIPKGKAVALKRHREPMFRMM
jgi:hypothetical protein